jgi:PAS domain S-box-containing protein
MGLTEEERSHKIELRHRAEQALQGKHVDVEGLSHQDFQYLLHELQVYQAELAIQNEELQRIQEELASSRDLFAELYNSAPVGYCTLNRKDRILEANQTFLRMLGYSCQDVLEQPLSRFVFTDDQDKYFLYRRRIFDKRQHVPQEIRLIKRSGEPVFVRLEGLLAHEDEGKLLLMLIDITDQHGLQLRLIEQREKERKKIASDLHDGPVQALAAVNFTLHALLSDLPEGELSQALGSIQAIMREQIQALRGFSVELRPPILAHLGLEMAIRSYVDTLMLRHPTLNLKLALNPVGRELPEAVSLALYRICQEALRNAVNHAGEDRLEVVISLKTEDHKVRLEISDNGLGFAQPENWNDFVQNGRLGMVNMRDRAEAVGGFLEVRSLPGKGTRIKAVVPLFEQR